MTDQDDFTQSKGWVNQGKRLVKRLEKLDVPQSKQFAFLKGLLESNLTAQRVSHYRAQGSDVMAAMTYALSDVKAKADKLPEFYGPLGRDLYMLCVHYGAIPGRVKSFVDDQLVEFGLCSEAQAIAGIQQPAQAPASEPFVDQESADRFPSGHRENY